MRKSIVSLSVCTLAAAGVFAPVALGAVVNQGSLTVFSEVSDLDVTGTFAYAIHTGGTVYSGNPVGNPYSGGVWGNLESQGADQRVGDAVFQSDMWNFRNEGKDWNRNPGNALSDGATFGPGFDDWRYYAERGTRYHGIGGGNDDGGIAGFANYISGHQNENAPWQSPYEGRHETDASGFGTGSSPDLDALRIILGTSGAQNLGGYDRGRGTGQRDITYDFDVTAGQEYKLQMLFFKNNSEATGMRIDVNGTTVVDMLDLSIDNPDRAHKGLLYTYTFTAPSSLLNLKVGRRTDDSGSNIGDINGITLEVIPEPATLGLMAFGAVSLLARRRRA